MRSGLSDADEAMMRRLFLSIPMRFKVIGSEDGRYFYQANAREEISMVHSVVSRTAVQRVFEFNALRERHGKKGMDADTLAEQWRKEVSQAPAAVTETVSAAYIKTAFRVWDNILSDPNSRDVILASERQWGRKSPFKDMTQLDAILLKGKSAAETAWLVGLMAGYVESNYANSGELSYRQLTGRGSNNKGLLDVFLQKKALLEWIHGTWLEQLPLPATAKAPKLQVTLNPKP